MALRKLAEVDALIARANEMKRLLQEGIKCDCMRLEDCEVMLSNGRMPGSHASLR